MWELPGRCDEVSLSARIPSGWGHVCMQFSGGGFSFNDSGEVAFQASLNGGAGIGAFVGSTSNLQAVALNGAPAPAGGNFSLNADILINKRARWWSIRGAPDRWKRIQVTRGLGQTVPLRNGSPGTGGSGTPGTFFPSHYVELFCG